MKEDEIYRMLMDSRPGEPDPEPGEAPALSRQLVQRFSNPLFLGEIRSPDGYSLEQGDCGDAMEVFLSVRDRVIRKARFDTLGCGFTVACGDMAMELAENRTLAEAVSIRSAQIEEALGGLPPSHAHCAELAVSALRKAVQSAMERARDPWKKHYGPCG